MSGKNVLRLSDSCHLLGILGLDNNAIIIIIMNSRSKKVLIFNIYPLHFPCCICSWEASYIVAFCDDATSSLNESKVTVMHEFVSVCCNTAD